MKLQLQTIKARLVAFTYAQPVVAFYGPAFIVGILVLVLPIGASSAVIGVIAVSVVPAILRIATLGRRVVQAERARDRAHETLRDVTASLRELNERGRHAA